MSSVIAKLLAGAVADVEAAEKTAVIESVKDGIDALIVANAPATEAEAVALVNANIVSITNAAVAAVKSPILVGLVTVADAAVVGWIEGIADGYVSDAFVFAVGKTEGAPAGAAEAEAQAPSEPTINVAGA